MTDDIQKLREYIEALHQYFLFEFERAQTFEGKILRLEAALREIGCRTLERYTKEIATKTLDRSTSEEEEDKVKP